MSGCLALTDKHHNLVVLNEENPRPLNPALLILNTRQVLMNYQQYFVLYLFRLNCQKLSRRHP